MPLPTKKQPPRIQIQAVEPIVDCGRYAVKRTVGERVEVYATIFKDGHDILGGAVRVRAAAGQALARGAARGRSATIAWAASFAVDRPGRWTFAVAAWTDRVATWRDELRRKVEAGQEDLARRALGGRRAARARGR